MIIVSSCIRVYGDSFSPKHFCELTKQCLADPIEPSEIGKTGRFKGKKIPYGSGKLTGGAEFGDFSQLDSLVDLAIEYKSSFKKCNATDITLDLAIYHDGQCNFDLPKTFLKKVLRSGLDLTISCYEDADLVRSNAETHCAGNRVDT